MKKLGKAARELLKNFQILDKVEENQVVEDWSQATGKIIAERTRAIAVRDGILRVEVPSSSWSQELCMLKNDIINRINNLSGEKKLKDIRFEVNSSMAFRHQDKDESGLNQKTEELTKRDLEIIKKATAEIKDPRLQQKVEGAIRSSFIISKKHRKPNQG